MLLSYTYSGIIYWLEKYNAKLFLFFAVLMLMSFSSNGQSAKESFKSGQAAQKKGNFKEALRLYSTAINLKADYSEAYLERANCNFALGQFESALPDYIYLHRLSPLNETYIYKSALTYIALKRWADGQHMLMKLEADDMNLHVIEAKIKLAWCKIMLKNYEEAVQYLSETISMFANDDYVYYYKGIACDSLKEFQSAALCYSKAVEIIEQKALKKGSNIQRIDSLKAIYLTRLGNTQVSMFDYAGAKVSYTKVLKINSQHADVYLARANVNFQINELNDALADLKSGQALNLQSYPFYYTQAKVLKKAGQFNLAIESLDHIISPDTAYHARFLKGQCLESIGNFEEAQKAYKHAAIHVPSDKQKEIEAALKRIRNRVYEFKRETESPLLAILSPALDIDKKIMIPKSHQLIEIKGKIYDKSQIKSIQINDLEADFNTDSLNPVFKIKVNLVDKEYLKVKIVDIYSNTTEQNFEFNRAEKNKPKFKLFVTSSEKDKQIYFDKTKSKTIKITGRIEDESFIKRVMINNKIASFNLNESNPVFEADIDVTNIDSIKILIIDEYDNVELASYFINSKDVIQLANNPMGKTWMVFIANSNYENFGTLTGPEKDLNSIRNAVLQYRFDNIITKYNMTLSEMEKFFRIELRDMIKEQGVNSILIWFAGHGKYTNETGYWLPVNARKDDEISYYPIPYLRSNLNSYGKGLRNVLIISDACESGPSFSLTDEKITDFDCKAIKAENSSAFVFSSTTNEKASDNSVFCETFADLLNTSREECLPMSLLVKSVSEVVERRQSQHCKYGKIKDIDNNSGNFFFIKRDKAARQ